MQNDPLLWFFYDLFIFLACRPYWNVLRLNSIIRHLIIWHLIFWYFCRLSFFVLTPNFHRKPQDFDWRHSRLWSETQDFHWRPKDFNWRICHTFLLKIWGISNDNLGVYDANFGVLYENMQSQMKSLGFPKKISGSQVKILEFSMKIFCNSIEDIYAYLSKILSACI